MAPRPRTENTAPVRPGDAAEQAEQIPEIRVRGVKPADGRSDTHDMVKAVPPASAIHIDARSLLRADPASIELARRCVDEYQALDDADRAELADYYAGLIADLLRPPRTGDIVGDID